MSLPIAIPNRSELEHFSLALLEKRSAEAGSVSGSVVVRAYGEGQAEA
ncbi:hypothetical protein [Bradyrhizobium canariense]|nr:hypothetical protein [Bradyrhizobium canariense]